jgi:AcrR family transcriptional regulator
VSTRETLMKVAAELMQEVGYGGMTTAAVARRARLAEGTIYRHFPSKEALAEAVFADIWRIFNEYLEAHLPPRDQPIERLEAFFPTTVEALSALMPRYGALAQQEHLYFASKHSGMATALPPGAREYVLLLEETIRLAQVCGFVRSGVDPNVAAHFLFFGAGQAMEFFGDPHHTKPGDERLPRAVFEQLVELMRHGLKGDRP